MFSARLTGSIPVANVTTDSWRSSQPERYPRRPRPTDIVIMVQIDLEHRDFIEMGREVVIHPFNQVLTTSVIDGARHRASGVQGGKNTTENERGDEEGLSAGHRAGAPTRYREDGGGS